ncbi:MAG: DUF58 domain-containing protein [Elusimicrobiota bacterium]
MRAPRVEVWRYRALRYGFLAYDWIRRRFTPAGMLALGAAAVSAGLGLDTEQSTDYQAFTFLFCLLSLAMLWRHLFRPRLLLGRNLPRFGTAGEAFPYAITARNLGSRVERGLSVREDADEPVPTLAEFAAEPGSSSRWARLVRWTGFDRYALLRRRQRVSGLREIPLPDLPGSDSCEVSAELVPPRRGKLLLRGLEVIRPDPVGIFKAFRRERSGATVLVLPKRYPVPRLTLPGCRRYQQGGVALSSLVGESQEFVSLRDYRPGDPIRRIHWKTWARTGKPVVKEYQDEYFVRHALALDTFLPAGGPRLEEAVSVAASFACSVLTQDSLLDLLFVGAEAYCFTAGRGLGGPDRILEVLACVEPCRDKPFDALAYSVLRRRATLSGCICVLTDLDEPRREFLSRMAAVGLECRSFLVTDGDAPPEAASVPGLRVLQVGKVAEGLVAEATRP